MDAAEKHRSRLVTSSSSSPSPVAEVAEEIRQLSKIALPMIAAGLLHYGKSVISMLFMGWLGKDALASGSLAIGFANITGYSVLSGLAMGLEPISAQATGARNSALVAASARRTVLLLLAASLPIAAAWIWAHPILLLCGQLPAISAAAATYLSSSLPNLLLLSFLNPIKIFLRTQNITEPLAAAAALALFLHAPINYLFVYHLGLGLRGVAVAAAAADFIFLLALLAYFAFFYPGGGGSIYLVSWKAVFSLVEWKPLVTLAVPSCAAVCLEWWWYELMILLAGLLSNAATAVAAMGILIQTTSFIYIFPSSLSLAVSSRVGNELGGARPSRARLAAKVALSLALLFGTAAALLTTALRGLLGRAFTDDADIVLLAAAAMPLVGLCELGNCPQTTGCGALRGSARPSLGANINLIAFYGVGLPVAITLGFYMGQGLVGLWSGLLVAQSTCAVVTAVVLLRTDWDLQAERARVLTCAAAGDIPAMREVSEPLLSVKVMENQET